MTTATTPIIAASYERVSTRNQGRFGFSLGAQHQSLEDFARVQGWHLPEHLRFRDGEDENASGADWDLPGLTALLDAAQRGEFQVLAVPDFDRFARTISKGLALQEQLTRYGVRVVFQRVPVDDSPEGRLQQHLMYSIAEYDREKIALRTRTGRRAKAQAGMVTGQGLPPYGYCYVREKVRDSKWRVCGLEPDSITAPVARRIFAELRHRSTAEVADALNADTIPAPRGGLWSPATVYSVAIESVYAGQWLYGKSHRRVAPDDPSVVPVPVPALVSQEDWQAVQVALARRRTARRGQCPREDDLFILRGALTCGHCGGSLHTHLNSDIRYYRCGCRWPSRARQRGKPTCVLADVHAAGLEAELWRVLAVAFLDEANLAAGVANSVAQRDETDRLRADRIAAIETEIAKQRHRIEALVDDLIDLGPEARAAVRRRMDDAESLIGRLTTDRDDLAAVRSTGLSQAEATGIMAFAAEIRDGLIHATPADLRELIERLDVRGAVYLDQTRGIQLCRKRTNLFRIEWTARIPLVNSDAQLNNWVIHKIADSGVITTLQRSVGGVDDSLWRRLPNLAPGQAIVTFTHMHRPVLTAIDPTPARLRMVD